MTIGRLWVVVVLGACSSSPPEPSGLAPENPPDAEPPIDAAIDPPSETPDVPVEPPARHEPLVLARAQHAPSGIAVDASHVYWTTADGNVAKVAITGGEVTLLATGQRFPRGIVVDATRAYWVNAAALGQVMAVPLAGGEPVVLADQQRRPIQLALRDGILYWTNNAAGTVAKLPVTGGVPVVIAERQATPVAITVDAQRIYWSSVGQGEIRTLPLAGGEIETIATDQDAASLFVVDSTLYWANIEIEDDGSHVFKLPRGGAPEALAATDSPLAAVADRAHVYWTDDARNVVVRTPIAGGASLVVASDQASPGELAIDATNVYWVDAADDGAIMKLAK